MTLSEAMRAALDEVTEDGHTYAQRIARNLVRLASATHPQTGLPLPGALPAIALLRDTAYGRPSQQVHQTGIAHVVIEYDRNALDASAPDRLAADRLELAALLSGEAAEAGSAPSRSPASIEKQTGTD